MANTIFYVADGNGTREANEQEVQMILDGQAKQEEEFQKNLIIQIKNNAMVLLSQTDWVELPSVSNTAITPHLTNSNDFLNYRNQIRAIAVNPTANVTWPTMPTEVWSS